LRPTRLMRGMSIRNPFLPFTTARQPVPSDDDAAKKLAEWRRQGSLAERERIQAILTCEFAPQQPRLAEVYAFESDTPARDAIAMMKSCAAAAIAAPQRTAQETADLIVLAGKKMRGEIPCDVNAGPKKFTKFSAEEILAAARKRDGK
jgi:hypothetical protein